MVSLFESEEINSCQSGKDHCELCDWRDLGILKRDFDECACGIF